uniref:Virion structural protein n=1 Tax=Burkholderia phage vB_BgluM-SURPRISE13 TaxID=3159457 RepID=A0AAU7PF14_9VIRU
MFHTINPIYSPESIAFQNDRFHREMTAIIDKYRTSSDGNARTELEIAVAKCIKDNTNISFDITVADMPMMTEPPHIDKNSPLLEGYGWKDTTLSKRSLADIRKSQDKEVRAFLDPNASWVDGYLADLPPIKMYLNAPMIYGNKGLLYKIFDGREYSSPEISAIILHEVGHVWSFYEHLIRFRTTNQILITLARELDGTQDHGRREMIIKEAGEMLSLQNVDATDLSNKNNTTVYTVIITNLARKNRSQSGVEGYDINSFEALSDQFATRHGAGKDLVTALDKMYKGTIYRRGWAGYFFLEFVKLAVLALGVFEIATGQLYGAYTTFALLAGLLLADSHHDWYDKAGARFTRIRNQLVEELKDPTLPKEDSARIRQDIDIIDETNKKFKDHTQLVGLVYDYLIPSGVNKRKQIEFQQSLEEMASNKLFYYANKFRNA